MNKYVSTRDSSHPVTSHEAIIRGISPGGGLYLPADISVRFDPSSLKCKSYQDTAAEIISAFFDDFRAEDIRDCVEGAYDGKFDTPEIVPLRKTEDAWLADLWHGPTSAFKDLALTILPRLMRTACAMADINDRIMILTATSGDTGKAALAGFADVENTYVTVFYPENGVSEVQKRQMQTAVGDNVNVIAVKGNFDDCQRMVKQLSTDPLLNQISGIRISSANSINTGRLIPQVVYYFTSYEKLVQSGAVNYGDPVDFAVPTGNFGDILAGYLARRAGLPVRKLICASNRNNVLTDFLNTGVYSTNRPFYTTMSPSMDILVSSNLERLISFESGYDEELVRKCMKDLNTEGRFELPESVMERIRSQFTAFWCDEAACAEEIRRLWDNEGILIDPHTAVAYHAMRAFQSTDGRNVPCIVLSTASAFKFPQDVYCSLGGKQIENGFEAMKVLHDNTGEPIPANLAGLEDLPVRFSRSIRPDEGMDVIRSLMEEVSHA